MERGLLIKHFAKKLGVREDTAIKLEVRWRGRCRKDIERIRDFIPVVS
jgi:hypothetical protein